MAVAYCTSDQVAQYLQRAVFSTSTTPTKVAVEDYIYRAEEVINKHTGTSWKAETVTNELHRMVYKPNRNIKIWRPQVTLDFRPVQTLVSGTDKLEIWNGSSWTDWVAEKTEGRSDDFWLDYKQGIVFFEKGFPINAFNEGVRVTYRYGHATVDKWVEELAVMMAALRVIEFDRTRMIAAGGQGDVEKPTLDASIRSLKDEIKERLDEGKWLTNKDRRPFVVV